MSKPSPERPGLLIHHGATVPTDADTGYATGCLFLHSDGAAGTALYVNEGDIDSCDFNVVGSTVAAAVIAALTATTATITTATISSLILTAMSAAEVATAEHAAGAIGTGVAPSTTRWTENGTIITETKIDLTGLASVATANDVIGKTGGGAAYIGKNSVALNGIIYKAELICLEVPAGAGADTDINVVANASAALEVDGAGGTAYGVNGGTQAAGQTVANLVQGLTADHYFYLTAGTGSAGDYTAGQLIFRTYGHPLLS
jgi:hypothetical protein